MALVVPFFHGELRYELSSFSFVVLDCRFSFDGRWSVSFGSAFVAGRSPSPCIGGEILNLVRRSTAEDCLYRLGRHG